MKIECCDEHPRLGLARGLWWSFQCGGRQVEKSKIRCELKEVWESCSCSSERINAFQDREPDTHVLWQHLHQAPQGTRNQSPKGLPRAFPPYWPTRSLLGEVYTWLKHPSGLGKLSPAKGKPLVKGNNLRMATLTVNLGLPLLEYPSLIPKLASL